MVKKNRMLVLAVVASVLLALIIWTTWGNTALELNTYMISRDRNSILPFQQPTGSDFNRVKMYICKRIEKRIVE